MTTEPILQLRTLRHKSEVALARVKSLSKGVGGLHLSPSPSPPLSVYVLSCCCLCAHPVSLARQESLPGRWAAHRAWHTVSQQ